MVKRGPQNVPRKKKEIYFNFKSLRQNLNDKQKTKLIKFFTHFRTMYFTVKRHLFQVNKMYDQMEQEYKQFQKDLFKDDEFLSGPMDNNSQNFEKKNETQDDLMEQMFKEEEIKLNNINSINKEENKEDSKDNFVELPPDFLEKDLDEIMNETKQRYDNSTNIINNISKKIEGNNESNNTNEKIENKKIEDNNRITKKENEIYTKKEEKNDNDDSYNQKFFDYKTWGNK